jgi:hypothetical protein
MQNFLLETVTSAKKRSLFMQFEALLPCLKKIILLETTRVSIYAPVVFGFYLNFNYLDIFLKKYALNFLKNPPVETEFFLWKDGRTDMKKKILKKYINPDTYPVLIPFQICTVKCFSVTD